MNNTEYSLELRRIKIKHQQITYAFRNLAGTYHIIGALGDSTKDAHAGTFEECKDPVCLSNKEILKGVGYESI